MVNELEDNEVKQEEDKTIVGIDSQGNGLPHYVIAERLVSLDCTYIMEDGAHKDVEYLADKLSYGWRGYHRMSPGELWTEYKEHEENFLEYYEKGLLICDVSQDDPLNTSEDTDSQAGPSNGQRQENSTISN